MDNKLKAKEITDYFISYLCKNKKPTTKEYNAYKKEVLFMMEND